MTIENDTCHPCKVLQLNKLTPGAYWCVQCSEKLCMSCSQYHKALKITKDHCLLTVEEYKPLENILSTLQTYCSSHKELIEYFCFYHDTYCCRLCKADYHADCTINSIGDKDKLEEKESPRESDRINSLINTLDILNNKMSENLALLENRKDAYLSTVEKKTELLRSIIEDLKTKTGIFEDEYQRRKLEIEDQQQKYIVKRKALELRHESVNSLSKLNSAPVIHFLATKKLSTLIDKDESELQATIKSVFIVKCTFNIRIQMKNNDLEAIDKMSFKSVPLDLNEVTEKNSSSTVENESTTFLQLARSSESMSSSDTEKVDFINKIPISHSKFMLKRISHFRVEKGNGAVSIRCVNVLPGGNLIFGEQSQPRLLVYEKEGLRKCEMLLKNRPESIAIDSKSYTAYVTSGQFILRIDAKNCKNLVLLDRFPMNDICYGVEFNGGAILVNCVSDGLKTVKQNGKTESVNNALKGKFQLVRENEGNFILVRNGSNVVEFYNSNTNSAQSSRPINIIGECGFANDSDGNLFISSPDTNQISSLGNDRNVSSVVPDYQLKQPMGLALDKVTNELIVITGGGNSLWAFEIDSK